MQHVKFATPLIAAASLLSFAACATHTHAHRKAAPHQHLSDDKDGRHFTPLTRNFDPPPPFGPRSNGSHH